MTTDNHFKSRTPKSKEIESEQPAVVEKPRPIDVTLRPTGDGSHYAIPQTAAGVEFCSAFYYHPLEYKDIYKTMMYPLEITGAMLTHFRVACEASGLRFDWRG